MPARLVEGFHTYVPTSSTDSSVLARFQPKASRGSPAARPFSPRQATTTHGNSATWRISRHPGVPRTTVCPVGAAPPQATQGIVAQVPVHLKVSVHENR